jgi:hypothetical protein
MRLSDAPEVQFALVDLTACYPPEAGVTQVWRAVWLIGRCRSASARRLASRSSAHRRRHRCKSRQSAGEAIMRAQAHPDKERMRAIAVSCEESATLEF